MLLVVAGSMVTRKYLCNVLVVQGLDRSHFRAEFSAAPLKPYEDELGNGPEFAFPR